MMFGFTRSWFLPGFAAIACGALIAALVIAPRIDQALAVEVAAIAGTPGNDWADTAVSARIVAFTGTVDDHAKARDLSLRLEKIPGIAAVQNGAAIAPPATPFTTVLHISGDKITIEGAVPSEADRLHVASLKNINADGLALRSGSPDHRIWSTGVALALEKLRALDAGSAILRDRDLIIEGRAASPRDFDALLLASNESAAFNVTTSIQPPLVTPYFWDATFDGEALTVSGYAPSTEAVDQMRESAAPFPVATAIALASGETSDFVSTTRRILENLVRLSDGSASILGGEVRVSGTAPTVQIAQAAVEQLNAVGAEAEILAPAPDGFWFSAAYGPDGRSVSLEGYVPDAATRQRLSETLGFDATRLKLASGAPQRFQSALDFVLSALSRLREGRVSIRDNIVTIVGLARNTADYQSLVAAIELGAPQGLILGRAEVDAPRISPFTWTAEKGPDGRTNLVGYIPSEAMRRTLLTAIDRPGSDTMRFASGQPDDFERKALAGLGVLARLVQGTLQYDGSSWTISGEALDATRLAEASAAFKSAGLAEAGWRFDVGTPATVETASTTTALPVADPYTWSATKLPNGAINFAGYVPSPSFRQFLMSRAGNLAYDATSDASGAPESFIASALAGFEALQRLREGRLAYSGTTGWSLTGRAVDTADRDIVTTILAAATQASDWKIDLTAPQSPPPTETAAQLETPTPQVVAPEAATKAPAVDPAPADPGPYRFVAAKTEDQAYALSGSVPTDGLLRYLGIVTGGATTESVEVRDGAPDGFVSDLLAGLRSLDALDSGDLAFDGNTWSLSGQPATADAASAAEAALNSASTPASQWRLALAAPQPPVIDSAEPASSPEPAQNPVAVAAPEPTLTEPQTSAPVAAEPQEQVSPYVFTATRVAGGPISLSGDVPAEPMRSYFGVIAGGVDATGLQITADPPADFLANAIAGIGALTQLPEGKLALDGGVWSLTGRATDAAQRTTILAGLPDADSWLADITLPPAIDACRVKVDALAQRNIILFRSGSALLAPESETALDELANDLAQCPEAEVNVEGHTDSDGNADANLALSVARAEAVVDALIQRGIDPERLYAVGYGQTLPIASNDTPDGKRLNRRIGFTLSEGDR